MSAWITVVGIGEEGLASLNDKARHAVEAADALVGGERHLAKVPEGDAERIDWRDGMEAAYDKISDRQDKKVVVLASGDPMSYGVGSTLSRRFGADALDVMPVPGAFSMAAARMGWSLAKSEQLTVHGRPLERVNYYLFPGARLLILAWDGTTPAKLARHLTDKGFGDSTVTVLEHLGGDQEDRIDAPARSWSVERTADLNTIAVEVVAGPDAQIWPRVPGLPEEAYEHDGKITKREVRAATVAALAPKPGEVLWDVGAGSGSVAIEWMRAEPLAEATAFEKDAEKCEAIERNAANLGVPALEVVQGTVPGALDLVGGEPDAVFVGGGIARGWVIDAAWKRLKTGGRLVANAVTVEAQSVLMDFHQSHGGELVRIAVAKSDAVGSMTGLRPLMEVLQLRAVKS